MVFIKTLTTCFHAEDLSYHITMSACPFSVRSCTIRCEEGLTATRAAVVQLSVPVIAALGAAAFLAEPITLRLVLASVATIGGVAIVLAQRSAKPAAA